MSRFTNLDSFQTGQTNVATATTPVQLTAASTAHVPDGVVVTIKAKAGNTGRINVGNSSTNALTATGVYFGLTAGQSISLQVSDLSSVWLDCTVNGEGVEWIVEKGN